MHTKYYKSRSRPSPSTYRRRGSASRLLTTATPQPTTPRPNRSTTFARSSYASNSSSSSGSSNLSSLSTASTSPLLGKGPRQSHSCKDNSSPFDTELCAPAYDSDTLPQYETEEEEEDDDDDDDYDAHQPTTVRASPNKLTKLVLGKNRARRVAISKAQRKAQRIDDAHAAWAAVGVDTRSAMARGEKLPPHFLHAPRCSLKDGMEEAIRREFGI